jgi:hypothetical protein
MVYNGLLWLSIAVGKLASNTFSRRESVITWSYQPQGLLNCNFVFSSSAKEYTWNVLKRVRISLWSLPLLSGEG